MLVGYLTADLQASSLLKSNISLENKQARKRKRNNFEILISQTEITSEEAPVSKFSLHFIVLL